MSLSAKGLLVLLIGLKIKGSFTIDDLLPYARDNFTLWETLKELVYLEYLKKHTSGEGINYDVYYEFTDKLEK